MEDFWKEFLTSNETRFRLARTILQGIIGVLIANADMIVEQFHFSADVRALIVALVMAVLSPIMSELGSMIETKDGIQARQYTFNTDSYKEMMGVEDEETNDLSEE